MRFAPTDPCPCGKAKPANQCCLKRLRWSPPEPTVKRSRRTGYANPACYAADLSDCVEEVSGEHFISRSVLKIIAPGGHIDVSGFPAEAANTTRLGFDRFERDILCERHNRQLSPLDAFAEKLFARLRDIAVEFAGNKSEGPAVRLFNGHALERWVLKVLCGAAFSGSASFGGRPVTGWRPPVRWLKILFEAEPLPPPCGLYFAGQVGEVIPTDPHFGFAVVGSLTSIVAGEVRVSGFRFFLAVEPDSIGAANAALRLEDHRLFSLRFAAGEREKFLLFGWPKDPRGDRNRELTVNWIPPSAGGASGDARIDAGGLAGR
jgi:hypothetical protein